MIIIPISIFTHINKWKYIFFSLDLWSVHQEVLQLEASYLQRNTGKREPPTITNPADTQKNNCEEVDRLDSMCQSHVSNMTFGISNLPLNLFLISKTILCTKVPHDCSSLIQSNAAVELFKELLQFFSEPISTETVLAIRSSMKQYINFSLGMMKTFEGDTRLLAFLIVF